MSQLLALPLVWPLLGAILAILGRRNLPLQRGVSVVVAAANFALAVFLLVQIRTGGLLVLQIGNWPAPYGITLVADLFSGIMLVMSGMIGLCTAVYGLLMIDQAREKHHYHVFFNVLFMGVNGAFLTGDLFNLYVWFETLLMASFVLLSLGGERPQLEGAIKYLAMNFLSSAFFLAGVGILYGIAGTLNLAELALVMRDPAHAGVTEAVSIMFLIAFGIKAAAFPLFFWLPASYHTPPSPVSAVFAGLLTKVGVYALIRVFTLLFLNEDGFLTDVLLVMAGFTMVTGVLGAAAQMEFRRLLSFHIVSQIGYMIMGLGLFSAASLAGAVIYIAHNIIAKTNLFFIAGVVARRTGTNDLRALGGMAPRYPGLALLFLVSAMALAGLPPLSGFIAKLSLVIPGFEAGRYAIIGVAMGVGLLTLFSMTKIWNEVFWKPCPGGEEAGVAAPWSRSEKACLFGPVLVLALASVAMGLLAGPLYDLALETGEQLKTGAAYIAAVQPDPGRNL